MPKKASTHCFPNLVIHFRSIAQLFVVWILVGCSDAKDEPAAQQEKQETESAESFEQQETVEMAGTVDIQGSVRIQKISEADETIVIEGIVDMEGPVDLNGPVEIKGAVKIKGILEVVHADSQLAKQEDTDLKQPFYKTYNIDLSHNLPRCSFLWVADSVTIIGSELDVQKNLKEVFEFCAQPHGRSDRSIQTLYISPYLEHPHGDYRYLERHPEDFAQFLRAAHYHGFKVEYLSSIGGLINDHEKTVTLSELDMLLNYNKARPQAERWDGIHYDIEPHTFAEWKIDEAAIWARNRSFFQEARAKIDAYVAENSSDFTMGLSVPTFHTKERLDDIFESMDYVGIMSYHDRPGAIIEAARPVLEVAREHSKKAWIYTENMPPSKRWGVSRSTTFAEEGHIYLEETLDEVYAAFKDNPSFKGFGYHEFNTHRNLKAEGYKVRSQESFGGIVNRFNTSEHDLEGKVVAYAKFPSAIRSELVALNDQDPNDKSLKLTYRKRPGSWCGWVTVFATDGEFIDLTAYSNILFDVRGAEGGERFTAGLADKRWYKLDDSVQSKDVSKLLPDGVTTEWQEVSIPLSSFRSIKLEEIASIGINFNNQQTKDGSIYIDNLRFE